MSDPSSVRDPSDVSEFQRAALKARPSRGPIGEFRHLLASKRKWWMAPIIVALLLVGAIIGIGGTVAGLPHLHALLSASREPVSLARGTEEPPSQSAFTG